MLLKLSKLLGMSDTTPGVDVLSKGSIESRLLEPREEFSSLAALHSLLVPPARMGPLRPHLDEWFTELRGPLNDWLKRLIELIFARRIQQKIAREKKENVG